METRIQIYLIFLSLGALIGAIVTPLVYWAKNRKPASGFFVGVILGGFGNLLLLVPIWLLLRPLPKDKIDTFDVAVTYNMGVAAVLGGRREEARFYFVQVTQADPSNISAWLYLANIATTPLEAWSYVQQARSIDPKHPGVLEATAMVWPQVRHLYGDKPM